MSTPNAKRRRIEFHDGTELTAVDGLQENAQVK